MRTGMPSLLVVLVALAASASGTLAVDRDCVLSKWTKWSSCDVNGYKDRSRSVLSEGEGTGEPCPPESDLSQTKLCDVDCQVGQWSQWGSCEYRNYKSVNRNRIIEVQPLGNGRACPPISESRPCPNVDCVVGTLGDDPQETYEQFCANPQNLKYSKQAEDDVLVPNSGTGKKCPPPSINIPRNCPSLSAKTTPWSPWSDCDYDSQDSVRTRTISSPPRFSEVPKLVDTKICPIKDCKLSGWKTTDPPCGDSNPQVVVREFKDVIDGGNAKGRKCGLKKRNKPCPVKECTFSEWTDWSSCAQDTVQIRSREITFAGNAVAQKIIPDCERPRLTERRKCELETYGTDWEVVKNPCIDAGNCKELSHTGGFSGSVDYL